MKDPIFFHQSAFLHASFYYLQIQVHRPFITKKSPLTFPSYAMCTNAARSCCNVLETAVTRGLIVFPNLFVSQSSLSAIRGADVFTDGCIRLRDRDATQSMGQSRYRNYRRSGERERECYEMLWYHQRVREEMAYRWALMVSAITIS